jgi:hypothetical protein
VVTPALPVPGVVTPHPPTRAGSGSIAVARRPGCSLGYTQRNVRVTDHPAAQLSVSRTNGRHDTAAAGAEVRPSTEETYVSNIDSLQSDLGEGARRLEARGSGRYRWRCVAYR